MKAIILSGGEGTRLRPWTYSMPKQLMPVANKPVLFYGIEQLAEAGIKEIAIIIGDNGAQVKEAVGNGRRWGGKITYITQTAPLGLAHAVKCAQDFVKDDPFVMYLGDNLLSPGAVKKAVDIYHAESQDTLLLLHRVEDPEGFGIAERKGVKILRVVEKPRNPKSNEAIIGVYLFNKEIFQAIEGLTPSWRGELEITDAIQRQIDKKQLVHGLKYEGWWMDTGNRQSLLEANQKVLGEITGMLRGQIDAMSTMSGHVIVEEGCRVEHSTIIGPVSIAAGSKIKNSYLGPYTSIGKNTILTGTNIRNSIILPEAKIINALGIISNSIIGREARIRSLGKAGEIQFFV